MRYAFLALLLAATACGDFQTVAKASPNTRLHAANEVYAITAEKAAVYARNCQAKPTSVCIAIVNRAQRADRVANTARVKANEAYAAGDNTDLAYLIGAAEGAIEGFITYYP